MESVRISKSVLCGDSYSFGIRVWGGGRGEEYSSGLKSRRGWRDVGIFRWMWLS
jgi:hypothetical protein